MSTVIIILIAFVVLVAFLLGLIVADRRATKKETADRADLASIRADLERIDDQMQELFDAAGLSRLPVRVRLAMGR